MVGKDRVSLLGREQSCPFFVVLFFLFILFFLFSQNIRTKFEK